MKQYLVLDLTAIDKDGAAKVVSSGDTREEAFESLEDIAKVGSTYAEVRILGKLIQPRERKSVTLSRVGIEDAVKKEAEAEECDAAPEPKGAYLAPEGPEDDHPFGDEV